MNLTSFLLGAKESSKKRSLDKDLDAVFKTQVSCVLCPSHTARNDLLQVREEPSPTAGPSNERKRKSKSHVEESKGKRSKSLGIEKKSDDTKTRRPRLKKTVSIVESKPENLDIKTTKAGSSKLASKDPSDSDGDDSDGPSNLVHETLRANEPKAGGKRHKFVPPDETQEQKDARTIFIGNVPPEVAQTRVSGGLSCLCLVNVAILSALAETTAPPYPNISPNG